MLSEDYAIKIARDGNVPESGCGFVMRFEVKTSYLDRYAVQEAVAASTSNSGFPPRTWMRSTQPSSA
ncbi:hypothetical protein ACFO6Q_14745 [Dokdonella ginsengisoli]|uniref:Uncharacterized protein n=1 Tax=Dokdonella ginsengisoli TaxID=363846 RepID=A0ABV9QW73_9GAMM